MFVTAAKAATTYIDFEHNDCEVGITPRPGLAAFSGGRVVNAYPPSQSLCSRVYRKGLVRQIEGRIRLLRRCRRACATSPGIGVKPSFYLPHTNVVPSRLPRMRQVKSVRSAMESLPNELCTSNVDTSRRGEVAVEKV